jgi:hypothetical protein
MNRRGNALAGLLVVAAIILLATVAFLVGPRLFSGSSAPASPRADGLGTTVVGQVKYAAKDDVCRSNLGQARLAVQVAQTSGEDSLPPSLNDLRLPAQFQACPIGKEPYLYDPTAGTVACPHPGHERY